MTEPLMHATNELLLHAVIALAARCAECDPRPTTRAVRAIAKELARQHQLDGRDRKALLEAAQSFAAQPEEHLEAHLASSDRDAVLNTVNGFAVPLEDRRVHRWMYAAVATALTAAMGAAIVLSQKLVLSQNSGESDCELAIRGTNNIVATVALCQTEYARTQDPSVGAKLANELWRFDKLPAAAALANHLLATPARSDALQVLGKIAIKEQRLDAGRTALETARELHVAERRPREIAGDDHALSVIFRKQKQFAKALRALDACITESREANDRVQEGYCHLSAGRVLGEVGYFEGAAKELDRAETLLVTARDLAPLAIERGRLHQRYGLGPLSRSYNALAVVEFERASQYASAAALVQVKRQVELNLVYSLTELGRTDEAEKHLEAARLLDPEGSDEVARALLEARIAYRRGDFALATSINTRVYDKLTDDDDRLRACVMQAEIGLASGDLEGTIAWAMRGVQITERMYRAQSAIELRGWVLLLRRQPYELLFTALARAKRFDDALVAFDQWQGRTLLDALARQRSLQPSNLGDAAFHTEELHRLFPVLSNAPIMETLDRDALIATLQNVELVVVLVANEEVWRITARRGHLDMVDVGKLATLEPSLDEFQAAPTNIELADALGARLLGDDAFRDTDETLFVLLDGPIASLPIAALRARGLPLAAMRPSVRTPRLSELGCVPALSGNRHAVVIADAHGDLPAARLQAYMTAALLGVEPLIGAAATRDALFAASGDDILHVATHSRIEFGGGSLAMYDQPVSAFEISTRRDGSTLVFLADSATAASDGAAMSLATAFLASGSNQVIATLRSVTDNGASEVTSAFYRNGGVADPARALAQVQAQLAQANNRDWPNFALFGHDICRK